MKRLLLFGAGGQVGRAIQCQVLPPGYALDALDRAGCDILDHRAVQKVIDERKPDLVINTAAMTNVDQCEKEKEAAVKANFEAPANLAAQCASRDIPLIHLSTDFVFDGKDGEKPYAEDAVMCPLSVYGETKMLGEMAVQQGLAWHVVLRVSSVFSEFSQNILTRALSNLAQKDELKIVSDQKAGPTYAPDLAKTILTVADKILHGQHGGFGIFHYCGEPAVTRLQFMETVMEFYAPHTSKRPSILPALSSDFPGFAERPPYSVLDCAKIAKVYGIPQKPWRDGVQAAIMALHSQGKLTS